MSNAWTSELPTIDGSFWWLKIPGLKAYPVKVDMFRGSTTAGHGLVARTFGGVTEHEWFYVSKGSQGALWLSIDSPPDP